MSRMPLVVVGLLGLVAGGVSGIVGCGGDTKTVTSPPQVVTKVQTRTKTVGNAPTKTVTRTKTVTAPAPSSPPPGDLGSDTSGKSEKVTGTRTFKGKGFRQFGTLTVKKTSTLSWTNSGKVFSVISQSQLHVSSTKKKGSTKLFKGTYLNFRVAAIGNWTLTLTPR